MRVLAFLTFGLSFPLALPLPAVASSSRPVCVRVKEATALVSLIVKPAARKVAGKKVEEKKESPLKISKYTPLTWTGKKEGRWLEVQNMFGQTYWVRGKDLSTSMHCLTVRVDQTRLYKGPGNEFEKADLALKGEAFLDMGGEDGWTQVQNSEGKRAWINLDHIWKPQSTIRMTFTPDK